MNVAIASYAFHGLLRDGTIDLFGYLESCRYRWGAEVVPENMRRLCEAVDHPGFGVLLHFRGNEGDALIAPWAMHTHIAWEITQNSLASSLEMLRDAGYKGCWSVEHHSGKSEHSEVAIQLAKVRDVLGRW